MLCRKPTCPIRTGSLRRNSCGRDRHWRIRIPSITHKLPPGLLYDCLLILLAALRLAILMPLGRIRWLSRTDDRHHSISFLPINTWSAPSPRTVPPAACPKRYPSAAQCHGPLRAVRRGPGVTSRAMQYDGPATEVLARRRARICHWLTGYRIEYCLCPLITVFGSADAIERPRLSRLRYSVLQAFSRVNWCGRNYRKCR